MRKFKRTTLTLGLCLTAMTPIAMPAASAQDVAIERAMGDAPYWDASLPVEQRVEDLLSRMTLDEKVAQLIRVSLRSASQVC